MVPFDVLNDQNHRIAELSKVLGRLVGDREMCDTDIFCELFERYSIKVIDHMALNKRHVYPVLLSAPDPDAAVVAERFLEGGHEIKRIFQTYMNKWCRHGLHIFDHREFVGETEGIIDLMWARIVDEGEQLYPLARRHQSPPLARSA